MRSALGGGKGHLMKLVHFRAPWAGEKKNELKKGPAGKNTLCFGCEGMGFPVRNVEEVN